MLLRNHLNLIIQLSDLKIFHEYGILENHTKMNYNLIRRYHSISKNSKMFMDLKAWFSIMSSVISLISFSSFNILNCPTFHIPIYISFDHILYFYLVHTKSSLLGKLKVLIWWIITKNIYQSFFFKQLITEISNKNFYSEQSLHSQRYFTVCSKLSME